MVSKQPVSEVATLFVNPDMNLEDTSSEECKICRESISVIASQSGYQRAYYGHHVEDRSKVDLVIDWDSLECHKRFMAAPEYQLFVEKFGRIFARPPTLVHFLPTPFPPSILAKAACTEVAMFYQTSDEFLGNVKKFMECLPGVDGYIGHCFGNVAEEVEKEEGSGKGKAVLLYIGWKGLEKHMAFRETEMFKINVQLLREGRGGIEMHHVAFKRV